jgi:peptidoglycan/LPS O-acetylase OafA/YrhL
MKYRREVDGLRAVAVMTVILFHAGVAGFGGGFLGVDVFFVISGYLISTILMAEVEGDRFSLVKFYERRARRILPALYVMMAAVTVAAALVLMPDDLTRFARSLVAVPLFGSNVLFWQESGYFAATNELKPLLHTWSLAVEEQFYLLFPLMLLLLRRRSRSFALASFALLFAVSLAAADWGSLHKPTPAFFLLPTRFWEPLAGVFVAYAVGAGWRDRLPVRLAAILSTLGLAMVAVAVAAFDSSTPTPGLSTLLPVVGTMLYLTWSRPTDPAGWLLSTKAMVGVGLVSYSAYLWHQPLFALSRYLSAGALSVAGQAGLIALTFALAYASWRWVEQPFRDARFNQARIFRWSLAGSLAFVAVGGAGIAAGGFESRFVASLSPADQTLYASMKENTGDRADRAPKALGECQFLAPMPTEAFKARFDDCAAKYGTADLVVGDSHGLQLFGMLAQADSKRFVVGLAQGGCRPFEQAAGCHYEAALTFATERRAQIRRVVFGHAGFYFFSPGRGAAGSRDLFRRPELPPLLLATSAIEATATYLERVAAVVPVVWVGPGIEPHVDVTNFRELRGADERVLPEIARRYRMLDAALAERVGGAGKVRYLSRIGLFEAEEPLRLYDEGCLMYRDTDHLSPCAERRLGPLLLGALE